MYHIHRCVFVVLCRRESAHDNIGQYGWFDRSRMHRRGRAVALCTGIFALAVFSQEQLWPGSLAIPEQQQEATASDSPASSVALSGTMSLYQTFKTQNRLDWDHYFKGGLLTQGAEYRYVQNPQSSIQFIDLSGMILYDDVLIDGLDAGIDWTPVVSYTKRQIGIMQSNVDMGPVVRHSLFSVPYTLRAGVYGYGWSDSLRSATSLSMRDMHGTPGIYGACAIGDPLIPVGNLPLFLNISATARSLGGNNLGLITASALFSHTLPNLGDSIFIHLGDSLTNGKELYIGEFEGKPLYSNTSWRINHSFSATGGMKMARRIGIEPRLYYRYFINSIAYPSNSESLDDLLRWGNRFGVAANTDQERNITYEGGIEFGREYEDYLFRQDFSDNEAATPENRAALIINQSDHYSNIVQTLNTLRIRFPLGLSASYSFNAMKDSKHYEFPFRDGIAVKWNQNENDRVQIDHLFSIRIERDSLHYIEAYGKYCNLYQYYYREQRSAESKLTHEYRIGLDMTAQMGPIIIRENVYGDVENSELRYAINLPPFSRDVTSTLSGKCAIIEDRLQVAGKWVEMYHDDGFWYARAYWPDSTDLEHEFYAIERKRTQYWLDFSFESLWENGQVSVGAILRDVFDRQWSRRTMNYIVNQDIDQGYGIEPYCRIEWQMSFLLLQFRVKRIFNTRDSDRYNPKKNWDSALQLQMQF